MLWLLATAENTITYHNAFSLSPQNCQFLLGPFELPGETEDNAYAKFWGDKQRALWYVMVFFCSGQLKCALAKK